MMILHTTVERDDCNLEKILSEGIRFTGYSQGVEVVLCSRKPYWLGCEDDGTNYWFDVEFEKDWKEVYIDIDDGTDFYYPYDYDRKYYLEWPCYKFDLAEGDIGSYGLFVYEVKPEEIVKISECYVREDVGYEKVNVLWRRKDERSKL